MEKFTVYFSQPVKYLVDVANFDRDTQKWYATKEERENDTVILYSLSDAKNLINANLDKYKGTCIAKICSNGCWINLGEIKI